MGIEAQHDEPLARLAIACKLLEQGFAAQLLQALGVGGVGQIVAAGCVLQKVLCEQQRAGMAVADCVDRAGAVVRVAPGEGKGF